MRQKEKGSWTNPNPLKSCSNDLHCKDSENFTQTIIHHLKEPKSRKMLSYETGLEINSITGLIGNLEKKNLVKINRIDYCKISEKLFVQYLTSDLSLIGDADKVVTLLTGGAYSIFMITTKLGLDPYTTYRLLKKLIQLNLIKKKGVARCKVKRKYLDFYEATEKGKSSNYNINKKGVSYDDK